MTVVIDTNCLLPMLSLTHPSRVIREEWAKGRFTWAMSTEILLEYQEIAEPRIGRGRWKDFLLLLEIGSTLFDNVRLITPHFRFEQIPADPDDNKFADCAIVTHAEWVITEDRHFKSMTGSGYKPQPIRPENFIRQVLGLP
jgi:putative PIN family toxin of toxin-antitoxin system